MQGQQHARELAPRGRGRERRLRQAGVGAQPDHARVGRAGRRRGPPPAPRAARRAPSPGRPARPATASARRGRGLAAGPRAGRRPRPRPRRAPPRALVRPAPAASPAPSSRAVQRLARLGGAGEHGLGAGPVAAAEARVDLEARPPPGPAAPARRRDRPGRPAGRAATSWSASSAAPSSACGRAERGVDRGHRRQGPGRRPADAIHGARVAVARRQGLGGGRGRAPASPSAWRRRSRSARRAASSADVEPGRVDRRATSSSRSARSRSAASRRARAAARARSMPAQPAAQHGEALGGGVTSPARRRRRARTSWLAGLTRRRCSCWAEKRTSARASAATRLPGRGLPVDQRAGAALGRHAAGQDHLALVVGELAQRRARGRRPPGGPRSPSGTARVACTSACRAPGRTAEASAGAPASRPRAWASTVLPAPVSPVIAVRPPAAPARRARSPRGRGPRATGSRPAELLPVAPEEGGLGEGRPGAPPSRRGPTVTERPGRSDADALAVGLDVAVAGQRRCWSR